MSITPRNDGVGNPTGVMPVITRINENLAKFAEGKKIRYVNSNDKLADTDGKLYDGMTVDRLHLSLKGYQIRADALKPILTERLGPLAKEDHASPPTGDPSAKPQPPAQGDHRGIPRIPTARGDLGTPYSIQDRDKQDVPAIRPEFPSRAVIFS